MFAIEQYLSARRALVEQWLETLLPAAEDRPTILHRAMRHSIFAGGKRLRPILAIAAAESMGSTPETATHAATALECVHTYSLIHDDLPAMDDDDLRRGKPTCHKAFSEADAILAGDALLTFAFECLAHAHTKAPFAPADLVRELAEAAGHAGMIAGQTEDIHSEGAEPGAEQLHYIHTHKTGALIRAAVRMGAICGGASSEQLDALTRYGEAAGLAFQIVDDVLNATSTAEELGKPVGSDVERDKMTFVSLFGLEKAREKADKLVTEAQNSLKPFGKDGEPLRALASYVVTRRI
jgi:geranylgeranyl diphosphate synthase type II